MKAMIEAENKNQVFKKTSKTNDVVVDSSGKTLTVIPVKKFKNLLFEAPITISEEKVVTQAELKGSGLYALGSR